MKRNNPHWIKRTHVFDPDEYECSVCGRRFRNSSSRCPGCGASLIWTDDPQDWVDEMMELEMILDDDD